MPATVTEHDVMINRWPRRILWTGLAILAIVVLTGFAFWWSWQMRVSSRLGQIRARGEPVTFAELAAGHPSLTAEEDTTELLLQAGKALQAASAGAPGRKLPYVGDAAEPPSPGQPWAELPATQQFLNDNAAALALLHQATERGGHAHFPDVTSPSGVDAVIAYASPLRCCGRVLRLEADVRAHEGDAHGAAEAIGAGLILSRSLENEPMMVSHLVRLAIFGSAAHELKQALPVVEFSTEDLIRFQDILQSIDLQNSLTRALIGERVFGLHMYNDLGANCKNRWEIPIFRVVRSADEAVYLDVMETFIASTKMAWPEMLGEANAVANGMANHSSRLLMVAPLAVPSLQATVAAFARAELTRRLALVAVAIERYRRQHGESPAELSALVPDFLPDVPNDPSSGQPLTYSPTAEGYVLYSPTKRFSLPSGEQPDGETGANPNLLFRRPAAKEVPQGAIASPESDADVPPSTE